MSSVDQWNELADIFGSAGNEEDIPEAAADNICIAWPSIIKGIEQTLPDKKDIVALDYGCGGGLFCRQLQSMGFQVTGYDPSDALAKSAQQNVPADVTITNSTSVIEAGQKYDLLSAIMVLQFIDNIDDVIETITKILTENGIIIYAVFNPAFVYDNMGDQRLFVNSPKQDVAYMELKPGVQIPFYIRSDADYRDLFDKHGMKEVYRDLPSFTAEFVDKYEVTFSTRHPEFLIQAFTR